jgi:hypothetical protein
MIPPYPFITYQTNFMDWPHSGDVMHHSEYMEPRDSAVSVLLSSQQKQLCVCVCVCVCVRARMRVHGVFRKKVHVAKGNCLCVV